MASGTSHYTSKPGRARGMGHRDSFSEDLAVYLAHSDWEEPNRQRASWLLCGDNLFLCVLLKVCERLEVIRHTDHLDAVYGPRFSSGLQWSVFNPIKGKSNSRSIDFKFLSISFA